MYLTPDHTRVVPSDSSLSERVWSLPDSPLTLLLFSLTHCLLEQLVTDPTGVVRDDDFRRRGVVGGTGPSYFRVKVETGVLT